jgi:hypothetical protein
MREREPQGNLKKLNISNDTGEHGMQKGRN